MVVVIIIGSRNSSLNFIPNDLTVSTKIRLVVKSGSIKIRLVVKLGPIGSNTGNVKFFYQIVNSLKVTKGGDFEIDLSIVRKRNKIAKKNKLRTNLIIKT